VVNIQTASPEELQRLPGIGPSKAAAIISFRERTAFRRVEDILRVRGIGRATFRRLRPYLTVSGPTTLASDARPSRAPAQDEAPPGDDAS
jgi:competence protein ComEA